MSSKSKYDEALFCLGMISELAGEEELSGCKEYNIEVTDEVGPAWRANQIGLYVERPFDQKLYNRATAQLRSLGVPRFDANKWIEKKDDGTMRYIQIEDVSAIASTIFNRMENECLINDADLTENEWEELQNSSDWDKTKIEIAREYIAAHLLETL